MGIARPRSRGFGSRGTGKTTVNLEGLALGELGSDGKIQTRLCHVVKLANNVREEVNLPEE